MRNFVFPILSVVLLFLIATQCSPPPVDDGKPELVTAPASTGRGIYRLIDRKAGVVCWLYDGYEEGGISCLPVKDTRLPGGQQ